MRMLVMGTGGRRRAMALAALMAVGAPSAASPGIVYARDAKTSAKAAGSTRPTPIKTGRVEANGIDYYYELHGRGEPLLLLHGGLGSIEMFGPVLRLLARGRRVIAVDLQGHGRTPLGDRPIRMTSMGDDMAVLLEKLGLRQLDVLGYSLGGGVALRLAVQHPDKVRRLVVVSAGYAQDGFYPEMVQAQAQVGKDLAESMKGTPMYQNYAAISPHPEDFPRLLDQLGELMRTPYDWQEDVKKLTMPVMLVYGDSDMFRPEHIVRFYQLLGGGLRDAGWRRENMSRNRLAILPNLTHYEIFLAPELARTVLPFLDGQTGAPSWSAQVPGQGKR
jgi:pimeloyl-ACP methyl ester carboxylesterase